MIVLAILATLAAAGWSVMVFGANGMRSSPGPFEGGLSLSVVWILAAVMWLAWWFN